MKKLIVLFQFRGRVGPADGAVIFQWGVSKTDGGGDGRVTCGRLAGLGSILDPKRQPRYRWKADSTGFRSVY